MSNFQIRNYEPGVFYSQHVSNHFALRILNILLTFLIFFSYFWKFLFVLDYWLEKQWHKTKLEAKREIKTIKTYQIYCFSKILNYENIVHGDFTDYNFLLIIRRAGLSLLFFTYIWIYVHMHDLNRFYMLRKTADTRFSGHNIKGRIFNCKLEDIFTFTFFSFASQEVWFWSTDVYFFF